MGGSIKDYELLNTKYRWAVAFFLFFSHTHTPTYTNTHTHTINQLALFAVVPCWAAIFMIFYYRFIVVCCKQKICSSLAIKKVKFLIASAQKIRKKPPTTQRVFV